MQQLMTKARVWTFLFVLGALFMLPQAIQSQDTEDFEEATYNSLDYRLVGPFRGGRSAAVTGVPGKPNLFYMGATGGGVWRTEDGGQTWENISDGFFGDYSGPLCGAEDRVRGPPFRQL